MSHQNTLEKNYTLEVSAHVKELAPNKNNNKHCLNGSQHCADLCIKYKWKCICTQKLTLLTDALEAA